LAEGHFKEEKTLKISRHISVGVKLLEYFMLAHEFSGLYFKENNIHFDFLNKGTQVL